MFARLSQSARISAGVGAVAMAGLSLYAAKSAVSGMSTVAAAATDPAFDANEFRKFRLREVQRISHNTAIYRFDLPTPQSRMGLPVASCIVTKADGLVGSDGKPIIRPYTPITRDSTLGYFDLLVKTYEKGNMSKHLSQMKPGEYLDVKGPIVKFKYEPNAKRAIGMVAGGTGITPMYQVIQEVLSNPNDKTNLTLVFANIGEEDILLRKELDALAAKHKNFRVHYVLEKPPAGWKGSVGYFNEELGKKLLPPPADGNMVFVCGPPGMMTAVSGQKNMKDFSQGELSGILLKLGYNKDQVFKF